MQVKLAAAALALAGCFHAHGHYRHHRFDAIDAILTTAMIVADVAQAAQREPAEAEPPPPPPDRETQAQIDARRELLDHLAGEVRTEALAGDCGTAAGTARMVANVDEGYFEAYVLNDPDVRRCLPWLQRM